MIIIQRLFKLVILSNVYIYKAGYFPHCLSKDCSELPVVRATNLTLFKVAISPKSAFSVEHHLRTGTPDRMQ